MIDSVTLSGRVGMLVHSYYLRDVRVRRAAEELAAAGVDVHVVCLREPAGPDGTPEVREQTVNGVRIHRLPLSRRRGGSARYLFEFLATTILGALKLCKLHFDRRFDVVHIHNMPDILVCAGLIPKWTGATLLLDVHDPMSELWRSNSRGASFISWAVGVQERFSYKLADRLVTVSDPMAENIAAKMKCDKRDITVVQNLPDIRRFPICDGMVQWPRHPNRFTVLYTGTVTEHYRLDIAVRAVALAAETIPAIRLRILGDGNRVRQVLDLAEELGISERVEYLKPVGVETVRQIMAEADVGISTHQAGVFGDLYFSNKLVEFLTQGLPVVTSRTRTVANYLPDDAVFFFPPGDPEGCARQLVTIWKDPKAVVRRLERARSIVQRLTWQTERRNLIGLYTPLLDGRVATHTPSAEARPLSYVLITPTRNEEAYIEGTIRSVVSQTILPRRWVIVSDGSTDRTDAIVQAFAREHSWIELVRMPERRERHFGGKARAFNAGYERVRHLEFDAIGNVDSDVSFGADYCEYLLGQLAADTELGVCGTHYIEGAFHSFRDSYINVHHVNGQFQFFRRRCFEDIGGYAPIEGGGIDWIAVTTARMKGWKTYSFPDRTFTHHRTMGTASSTTLKARFHYGTKDYFCGGHPIWQLLRSSFQMTKEPYVVGGLLLLLGYFWSWMTRAKRHVPDDLMKFHREEQMQRLKELFVNKLMIRRSRARARLPAGTPAWRR